MKDEKKEEVSEASEEIGKDVDEVEEKVESNDSAMEEAQEAVEKVETLEEGDAKRWENVEARLAALEEAMKGYSREPKETDKTESDKLNDLAKKFE